MPVYDSIRQPLALVAGPCARKVARAGPQRKHDISSPSRRALAAAAGPGGAGRTGDALHPALTGPYGPRGRRSPLSRQTNPIARGHWYMVHRYDLVTCSFLLAQGHRRILARYVAGICRVKYLEIILQGVVCRRLDHPLDDQYYIVC